MNLLNLLPKHTVYLVWTFDEYGFLHVELTRV